MARRDQPDRRARSRAGRPPARRSPAPRPAGFARISGLPAGWGIAGVSVVVLLVNGLGEETGWRGFAVNRLQQRFDPLTTALIVTSLWALWHVPMFLVLDSFRGMNAAVTAGWLLGLAAGSIVLTWLYHRSGESILLVAIWHAGYNIVAGTQAAEGFLAAFVSTLVMIAAVALAAGHVRARRRDRPSPMRPVSAVARSR